MSRCVPALLLTACGVAPVAVAADAITVIDRCIHSLDPAVDVGYAHVAERCPELEQALASSPYAAWLPPDWRQPDNELSLGGLVELRGLLTRSGSPPAVPAPRVARVAGVLSELQRNHDAQRSWWARFKQWLRELLAPQPGAAQRGWLERLIGGIDLSQSATRAIVWGALSLVLLLAGAVVANELRIAGWWRTGRPRARREQGGDEPGRRALSLDEVDRAAAEEQPQLLLQLVIRRLSEQQRLPPARALTLNELQRAARLGTAADRDRLAALAAACERVRFAGHVAAPLLEAGSLRGRQLLASLETLHRQPANSS